MNDDELLRELTRAHERAAHTREPGEEAWESLAAGTVSEDERRALAEARERNPVMRQALEALDPLGASFHARTIARIERERAAAIDIASRAPNVTRAPQSMKRPRPSAWRRATATGAAFVAMAAALVVWFRAPDSAGSLLPVYELSVRGGQQDERAIDAQTHAESVRIGRDSDVTILLQPVDDAPPRAVALHAWIVRRGHAEPWFPHLRIASSGALAIDHISPDAIGAHDGRVDVVLVVAPGDAPVASPDDLPKGARAFRVGFDVMSR